MVLGQTVYCLSLSSNIWGVILLENQQSLLSGSATPLTFYSRAPLRLKATEWSTVGKQICQPIDLRNFGSDVSIHPYTRTDSGGGGRESQGNLLGGRECHLFLAGNHVVLLDKQCFSQREIT